MSKPDIFVYSDVYDETEEVEIENEFMLLGVDEPNNYSEAATEQVWQQAMKDEINVIVKNNTWELVKLTPRHKAVGLKWVYKLKRDTNGEVIKHKTCLVAKGYVQKQ